MTRSFDRFSGIAAIAAGVSGLLYSVSFVVVARADAETGALLSAIFLTLGGLLSSAVFVALYSRLRETDASFALWALVLGLAGALGSMIHGGYDLANALNPPAQNVLATAELPNQIDPRGLLTFGVTGLAIGVAAWLVRRDDRFPNGLAWLGLVAAALLVMIYLGRLIVLDPTSPLILAPAALAGFIVNPAWLVWLGYVLLRWPGQARVS